MGVWMRRGLGLALLLSACTAEDDGRSSGTSPGLSSASGLTTANPSGTDGPATSTTANPTSGNDSTAGTLSSGAEPVFDIGVVPDGGGPEPSGPVIPETCLQAEDGESSVGCVFYAVDMDSSTDGLQFAVAAANVQLDVPATVVIQTRENGVWTDVVGPTVIEPLQLSEFPLADRHQEGTGQRAAGAYRIQSDVPIVAYQFQPVDGQSSFLSDASMLYPVPTWDSINQVVSTRFASSSPGAGYPYITIVAGVDGTNVQFTATNATTGGGGIPPAAAGQTISFPMSDGDIVSLVAANQTASLSGSRVVTDDDHPVAVLSGHTCINIPDNVCCCDHLEEQISGVRQWGQRFVASHMPYRNPGAPEQTFWQVLATEDNTVVSFDANPMVMGVPNQLALASGQISEFFVNAPAGIEADFTVESDKPIALVGYMTSSETFGSSIGDPAMAQFVPVEQYLPRYVILVPGTWDNDVLLLTRPAGAQILLDQVPIDDAQFAPVGTGEFEVARVTVSDGVHVLDGEDEKFGVVVVGWDTHDSYAYIGGTGTGIINPNPAG